MSVATSRIASLANTAQTVNFPTTVKEKSGNRPNNGIQPAIKLSVTNESTGDTIFVRFNAVATASVFDFAVPPGKQAARLLPTTEGFASLISTSSTGIPADVEYVAERSVN